MTNDIFKPEQVRSDWLKYEMRHVDQWLDYLERRLATLEEATSNDRDFISNDVIFGVCSALNRMAQIHYATHKSLHIREKIVPWLGWATKLPEDVAAALWYGVRNPILHMGSWSPAVAYPEAGGPTVVSVVAYKPDYLPAATDVNEEAYITVWPESEHALSRALGWFHSHSTLTKDDPLTQTLDLAEGAEIQHVTFIVDELIELGRAAREVTAQDLEGMNDGKLRRLEKLNYRLSFGVTNEEWTALKAEVQANRSAAGMAPLDIEDEAGE